ncbi:GntR family transcriptional regulator [Antribacter gilvus]|uniref:GntR family transcriptional regulator n=1 Tax=Antribacter gilvus TaxID=2304675 RepID=UPI000F78AAFF|nr:GntR family transcriptional regulator [Antribacter gilvus]
MTTTFERIAADIGARIASGELAPGDRVPSTRRIVADYGVAMATATRALDALQRRGLVEARRGVGTVVVEQPGRSARDSLRSGSRTAPTVDDVVRAAMAIADEEGLPGLSMRRIATDLGLPTMSLYRHVANRDELLAAMLDRVYAAHPLPDPLPDGWRDRAEACARTFWTAFQRHPWAAHAMSITRPQVVPHGVAHTEAMLAAFDRAPASRPLDLETRMHLAVTLFLFVRGVAVNIEPALAARQDTGLSDEDWMNRAKPPLQAAADPRQYPHLARATASELDITLDSLFETGLARLLDGYEVFLTR